MVDRFLREQQSNQSDVEHTVIVEWKEDLRRSLTIVHVIAKDQPRLFEKLAGSFAVAGMNILSARAFTRNDGVAIDMFFVESERGGAATDPRTREAFEQIVREILADEADPLPLIRERRRKLAKAAPFAHTDKLGATIPPNVDVYRDVVVSRTIVEVRAADHLGLLHLIARNIADCGLNIVFARIATEQGMATDVFHVESAVAEQTYSSTRYLDLRERLGEALTEGRYHIEV
tara:strand:- start:133 stop:828 length:696 start_codon:yes stop_codon:yes gene_type:complete